MCPICFKIPQGYLIADRLESSLLWENVGLLESSFSLTFPVLYFTFP